MFYYQKCCNEFTIYILILFCALLPINRRSSFLTAAACNVNVCVYVQASVSADIKILPVEQFGETKS